MNHSQTLQSHNQGAIEPDRFTKVDKYILYTLACFYFLHAFTLAWLRGMYVAGYETLAPAKGLVTIHEQGLLAAIIEQYNRSRDFAWWNPTHSLLFSIVPGILHTLITWEYWAQVVTPCVCMIGWYTCVRALKIRCANLFSVLSVSVTSTTFFVVGYPYLSGTVPYAFALAVIFYYKDMPFSVGNFLLQIIAWFLINEVALHCYEMGKSYPIVLFVAALSLSQVSVWQRITWLVIGGVTSIFVIRLGKNNFDFALSNLSSDLGHLHESIWSLFRSICIRFDADTPVLLTLGIISLVLLEKNRWFWRVLLMAQLGLLLVGALRRDTSLFPLDFIVPRRFLLIDWISAISVCIALQSSSKSWFLLKLPRILFVGALISATISIGFFYNQSSKASLPYTSSKIDFDINKSLVRDTFTIASLISQKLGKHYLMYDLDLNAENFGDPQGIPERLLLKLGYETMEKRVTLLGYRQCRFWCLPSQFFAEPEALLDSDTQGILYVHHERRSSKVLGTLFGAQRLKLSQIKLENFDVYEILPQVGSEAFTSPFIGDTRLSQLPLHSENLCMQFSAGIDYPSAQYLLESGMLQGDVFSFPDSGTIELPRSSFVHVFGALENITNHPAQVVLQLEYADEVRLLIDGVLIHGSGPGPHERTSITQIIELVPGRHSLSLQSMNLGKTRLSFSETSNIHAVRLGCQLQTAALPQIGSPDAHPRKYSEMCVSSSQSPVSVIKLPYEFAPRTPTDLEMFATVSLETGTLAFIDIVATGVLRMWLDEREIINLYDRYEVPHVSGVVSVSPGQHTIRVEYKNKAARGLLHFDMSDVFGDAIPMRCEK